MIALLISPASLAVNETGGDPGKEIAKKKGTDCGRMLRGPKKGEKRSEALG
jgi:hypothetical protein